MKPPVFEYQAPSTLYEAVTLLSEGDEDIKVIAGGQSLVPMMNFRLARPSMLVDINGIEGLGTYVDDGSTLTIGAIVRHVEIERSSDRSALASLLRAVAGWVGHLPIRTRGTVLGSLAHADPSAEWPLVATVIGGELEAVSVRGTRSLPAADFFESFMTTRLESDEVLTSWRLPHLSAAAGWGFQEFSRRAGDFAVVSALAHTELRDGRLADVRLGLGGVASIPTRLSALEAQLAGSVAAAVEFSLIQELVSQTIDPASDGHGSADYKRRLAATLVARALARAIAAAPQESPG